MDKKTDTSGFLRTVAGLSIIICLYAPSGTEASDDIDKLVESFARKAPTDKTDGSEPGTPFSDIDALFEKNPSAIQAEILKRGQSAIPALKRGLKHFFPIVRRFSFETLVKLQVSCADLQPALKDSDPDIRYEAGKHFIKSKRIEGIVAVLSCMRRTSNGGKKGIYASLFSHVTRKKAEIDWGKSDSKTAEGVIKEWEAWWAAASKSFKFDDEPFLFLEPRIRAMIEEVAEIHPDELADLEKAAGDPSKRGELETRIEALLKENDKLDYEQFVKFAAYLNRAGSFKRAMDLCRRVTDETNREKGASYNIYCENAHYETVVAWKGLGDEGKAKDAIRLARILAPGEKRFEELEAGLKKK